MKLFAYMALAACLLPLSSARADNSKIEMACKSAALEAATALQQISYNHNGCEVDCDESVQQVSLVRTEAHYGSDNNDIHEAFEIVLANGQGISRKKYVIETRSYDIGLCTFSKIETFGF